MEGHSLLILWHSLRCPGMRFWYEVLHIELLVFKALASYTPILFGAHAKKHLFQVPLDVNTRCCIKTYYHILQRGDGPREMCWGQTLILPIVLASHFGVHQGTRVLKPPKHLPKPRPSTWWVEHCPTAGGRWGICEPSIATWPMQLHVLAVAPVWFLCLNLCGHHEIGDLKHPAVAFFSWFRGTKHCQVARHKLSSAGYKQAEQCEKTNPNRP